MDRGPLMSRGAVGRGGLVVGGEALANWPAGAWVGPGLAGHGSSHALPLSSDGTLNPNGVRFGSSEIYNIGTPRPPFPPGPRLGS